MHWLILYICILFILFLLIIFLLSLHRCKGSHLIKGCNSIIFPWEESYITSTHPKKFICKDCMRKEASLFLDLHTCSEVSKMVQSVKIVEQKELQKTVESLASKGFNIKEVSKMDGDMYKITYEDSNKRKAIFG